MTILKNYVYTRGLAYGDRPIFITGIFGNFYTKRGWGIFDFQNGNPDNELNYKSSSTPEFCCRTTL